jgi:hypothetical protein
MSGLLRDFPDVVSTGKTLPAVIHDVEHHINTSGPLIASKFRRLEGEKLEAAHKEFKALDEKVLLSGLLLLGHLLSTWNPRMWRHVEALWRFPEAKPRHRARCIPPSQHAGLFGWSQQLHSFFKDKPAQRILAGTSEAVTHFSL